ncbi:MAG: DUF4190 domain-containing protein, partial [Bacteroidia bacterium]|nr:DUF4190 domain-containing protein [Bacteroidia bacterium]
CKHKMAQSPRVIVADNHVNVLPIVRPVDEIKEVVELKPLTLNTFKAIPKQVTISDLSLTSASYIPGIKNLSKLSKLIKKPENYKLTKAETKTHWAALAGMICGILGVFGSPLLAICGIVFSCIGLNKIKKNPDSYKGKGMAIAGLVTGIVGVMFILALASTL